MQRALDGDVDLTTALLRERGDDHPVYETTHSILQAALCLRIATSGIRKSRCELGDHFGVSLRSGRMEGDGLRFTICFGKPGFQVQLLAFQVAQLLLH
ncbi:MAG TPA: hypothetical protein PKB04_08860 [Phenylobacterium sp.]|nr:hypothetical protein [Phenylobacterium sp.]